MLPPLLSRNLPQFILLPAVFLLITAATLLPACAPATPASPATGNALTPAPDSNLDPEALPPTPKSTNHYPKLHSILQQLVRNYEAGSSTERQAAAQAPLFYDRAILITADIPANIDAVDKWMASQNISPRHKEVSPLESLLYAYVPVSLLGDLSRQAGVSEVNPVLPDWIEMSDWVKDGPNLQMSLPGTPTPTPDPDNPIPPKFPYWMKEMLYLKLSGQVLEAAYRYEEGYLTEAEAARLTDDYQGSSVLVEVILFGDSQAAEWLKSKGVSISGEVELFGYIPVSLLKPLSDRPDVHQIIDPRRPVTR